MDPAPAYLEAFLSILLQIDLVTAGDLLWQVVLFLLLMIGSFLASSSEVAFFSLTKAEIEDFHQLTSRRDQQVWTLVNHPRQLLATILITNNFVNVAAILVAGNLLRRYVVSLSDVWQLIFELVVITSVLLFFGEIVPKVYAVRNRIGLVRLTAMPLSFLRWFFTPLSSVLIRGTSFIDRALTIKTPAVSLEDLKNALDIASENGAQTDDKDILKGIVNFSNITVKSVMRARVDVKAVEIETPFADLITFIQENNYSRLPVYEETLDQIRGILHIKDLLPYLGDEHAAPSLRELMREVHYVPESKKIDVLLDEFKAQRLHMAVVVDEFGGTAGIVTMEDIIEEIFGEINDEFDRGDWTFTKLTERSYLFEGRISLNDLRRVLDLDEATFEDARGDSDSLGGLILELHGKIPIVGERIHYRNFDFQIEAVNRNRITMVKLYVQPEENTEVSVS